MAEDLLYIKKEELDEEKPTMVHEEDYEYSR